MSQTGANQSNFPENKVYTFKPIDYHLKKPSQTNIAIFSNDLWISLIYQEFSAIWLSDLN